MHRAKFKLDVLWQRIMEVDCGRKDRLGRGSAKASLLSSGVSPTRHWLGWRLFSTVGQPDFQKEALLEDLGRRLLDCGSVHGVNLNAISRLHVKIHNLAGVQLCIVDLADLQALQQPEGEFIYAQAKVDIA